MFDWGWRRADLHRFLRSGCQRASFLLPAGECHRVEDEDDPAVAKRAFDAMMTMRKIDVATIEAAVPG